MKTAVKTIETMRGRISKGAGQALLAVLIFLTGSPVYASDLDATSTLRTTLNLVFSLMTFGGIILTGYGVVLLAKAIASPDSSDPHGITRGIGAIVGGVIMIAVKSILSLIGVDIDSFSLV